MRAQELDGLNVGTVHRLKIKRRSASKDPGFSVMGGSDYAFGGVFISGVSASKAAAIKEGDRLIAVDAVGMLGLTLDEANSVLAKLPAEFTLLLLRLGALQWKQLLGSVGGKPRMGVPGPFFRPFCRAANLPLMDGVT